MYISVYATSGDWTIYTAISSERADYAAPLSVHIRSNSVNAHSGYCVGVDQSR